MTGSLLGGRIHETLHQNKVPTKSDVTEPRGPTLDKSAAVDFLPLVRGNFPATIFILQHDDVPTHAVTMMQKR